MRTYTINGGMLDSYLELFNKQVVPNHKIAGIPIVAAWINRNQSEITWVRTFATMEERAKKLDAYEASAAREALFPLTAYHLAKAEIRILEDALNPTDDPVQAVLDSELATKARAAMAARPPEEARAYKAYYRAPR